MNDIFFWTNLVKGVFTRPTPWPSLSQSRSKFNIVSMGDGHNGSGTHSGHQGAHNRWYNGDCDSDGHGVRTCKQTLILCHNLKSYALGQQTQFGTFIALFKNK